MNRTLELEKRVREEVYDFFAEQCDVDIEELSDDTNIIEDIDGDSLMFLQLLESWKRQYNLEIEFRIIGKFMTKNPAETIGKTIELALTIICEKDKFMEMASA